MANRSANGKASRFIMAASIRATTRPCSPKTDLGLSRTSYATPIAGRRRSGLRSGLERRPSLAQRHPFPAGDENQDRGRGKGDVQEREMAGEGRDRGEQAETDEVRQRE